MSLSGLETAVLDYVADAIEAARGIPLDRTLRYHGRALPEDCCTENGTLSISTVNEYHSPRWPVFVGLGSGPHGAGPPAVELHLRFVTCWPVPEVEGSEVAIDDDEWDTRAAALAEVADAGSRALLRVSCASAGPAADIRAETGCVKFRWLDCTPTGPGGGCAGWQWRCVAAVASGPPLVT